MTAHPHSGPFQAVLYDFDGTLGDSTELILRCYRHTMRTHLGHVPSEAEWRRGFGTPLEGQLARLARSPEEAEAMVRTYRAYQRIHHDDVLTVFPDACETVAELDRRGVKLAIVTSKHREEALRGIGRCGLTSHFPVIVAPEDVERTKPHPEPVLLALKRLGVSAEAAVFVGDSPHDVVAGHAAGVATAAALWGPFPPEALRAEDPDFLLRNQAEVLRLVSDAAEDHRGDAEEAA